MPIFIVAPETGLIWSYQSQRPLASLFLHFAKGIANTLQNGRCIDIMRRNRAATRLTASAKRRNLVEPE